MSSETNEKQAGAAITASDILWLSKENASFEGSGDFLGLTLSDEASLTLEERLREQALGDEQKTPHASELTHFPRVCLHRAFPFDEPDGFISVFDSEGTEIGIIRALGELSPSDCESVKRELERKYYTPKVKRILSVREKRGFSVWRIDTDAGIMELSMRDTFRSIIRANGDRVFLADASGGRYEIESVSKLDSRSRKKIEIYL